ncbi:hypothetical protein PCC7424_1738 [Gloeothece citriformis PCC 7424]|uniref:Uncharacterized protein n=1 Tax=Gloeothece citriformis (strain PCC 7424) TaxID=65393 RepID=B7KB63_GLOC7|nr:hypothetical protein PCC7424_1738 [Gloeothece citriformis PCC 7424]
MDVGFPSVNSTYWFVNFQLTGNGIAGKGERKSSPLQKLSLKINLTQHYVCHCLVCGIKIKVIAL